MPNLPCYFSWLRLFAAASLVIAAVVAKAAPPPDVSASATTPVVAPAAATTNATPSMAVADFSKGFALLHSLGVTNVSKAAYVTLSGPEALMFVSRGGRLGLSGNAWQLAGDATNGVFLVTETTLVRATTASQVVTNRMDQIAQMRRMYYEGEAEGGETGDVPVRTLHDVKWAPADLQADLNRLLPKLQKDADKYLESKAKAKAKAEADEDPMMAQMREQQTSVYGYDIGQWVTCLLCAAHVADQGHLAEANRLAALAMTLGGGNKQLLEAVMDRLGNEAYQKVWAQFRATGDWAAYAAGIDAVVARFPRGWKGAATARELAPRIRAFGAAGARPALQTPLPPASQSLVDALATAPASREADTAYQQPGYWVLPRDTNDMIGAWVATNAHPLARLLRSGTNAIPVLLALLDDAKTFTHLQTYAPLAGTNAASASEEPEDERARMMREMEMGSSRGAMLRPALRNEVATQLLNALVGENQHTYYSSRGRRAAEGKSLAERVRTWQEERAGMTPEMLAFACLVGKDNGQRAQAVQYIAASSSTSAWQRLEKYFLNATDQDDSIWLAQTYVQRRGKDAKPFVDALEARIASGAAPTNAVKTAAAGGEEEELFNKGVADDSRAKYRRQQQQRTLKEMRRIVDAKPFDVVVDEIASGKISPEAGRDLMARSFYEVPYTARVTAAVRAAAKAQTPDVRIHLLWLTLHPDERVMAQYAAAMAQCGGAPVATQSETPAVAALADAWRALLADTRLSTNRVTHFWFSAPAVCDVAAIAMEMVYASASANDLNAVCMFNELGSDGLQLLRKRAESRVSGAAVIRPALPDSACVAAGRLAELTNSLPRAALNARAAQITSLTADERLALARAARTNPGLAAALAPIAHRMHAVLSTNVPATTRAALQGCDGKVMDAAVVQELVRQCGELAKQGQAVTFKLMRRAGCGGVDVSAHLSQPDDAIGCDAGAGVGIGVETLDGAPEAMLLHPGTPVAAPGTAGATDDPLKRPTDAELIASEIARLQRGPMTEAEAEAAFWKRMEALCTTDPAIGFPAGIRITPVLPEKTAAK